jgi:hypothetical protein
MWTAEDGSVTNFPFGVHQIYEEIVAPVVQNLMDENRIERLKIYNHIKDQKIDYLNKWHQDTDSFYRANRAESADVINLMQESLREYVAAYNTLVSLQKTEDSMVQSGGSLDATVVEIVDNSAETLAAFELQSQEFQRVQSDFENYMERLKEDIDIKAEKFGHIEYYDAKLRDGNANELAVAADEIHDLDVRRKPLATVNPLFAKASDLPPAPQVEDITFEHISLHLPSIAKNALDELNEENSEDMQDSFYENQIVENEEQDDEISEENENNDEENDNNEFIYYSEEELNEMSDTELQDVCDSWDIDYDVENFVREESIAEIIEVQNANNEFIYYSEEELSEMSDIELQDVCDSWGIDYDVDNFVREESIAEIIEVQNANEE